MKCLCCNKEITEAENSAYAGWHRKCIKKFFETDVLPEISLKNSDLIQLANEVIKEGVSATGVQKKLSLHLSTMPQKHPRLTIVDYPAGYILKPQTEEFEAMPEAEFLTMKMAERAGLAVSANALLKTDDTYAYITKRIDRSTGMLAMEDFCQLSQRLTEDKYKGSYEKCCDIIFKYSSRPGLDAAEFFARLIFCFVTGNSDMHLKNFSMIEKEPGSREFMLSKAYDLLPVNVIMPEDTEECALALNGKKSRLTKKDFLKIAQRLEISPKTAEKIISKMIANKDGFLKMTEESYLPQEMKESLEVLITDRCERLA